MPSDSQPSKHFVFEITPNVPLALWFRLPSHDPTSRCRMRDRSCRNVPGWKGRGW